MPTKHPSAGRRQDARSGPSPGRDHPAEDFLLQRAAGRVDDVLAAGYPDACRARLELGERRYGGSWRARSTLDSLREMQEEEEDSAVYAVLAIQALGDVGDRATRQSIGSLIQCAMAASATAWTALEAARRTLEEANA